MRDAIFLRFADCSQFFLALNWSGAAPFGFTRLHSTSFGSLSILDRVESGKLLTLLDVVSLELNSSSGSKQFKLVGHSMICRGFDTTSNKAIDFVSNQSVTMAFTSWIQRKIALTMKR